MKSSVLIVDDDGDMRKLMRLMLSNAGFEVLEAGDGEQAMALVYARPPAVCVLDLMMPQMTGVEVCRQLRQHRQTRALPILILTAYISEANWLAALRAGATDYMAKPFLAHSLVDRVRQLVA